MANAYFKAVKCASFDMPCNQNKTVAEVLAGQVAANKAVNVEHIFQIFLAWAPVIGPNTSYVDQPLIAFQKGNFSRMPIMLGSLFQEAYLITGAIPIALNSVEFDAAMVALYRTSSVAILKEYPKNGWPSDLRVLAGFLLTHYSFVCPTRNVANAIAAAPNAPPIYYYHFNHSLSFDGWGPKFAYCRNLVCHGAELPFVFVRKLFNFTLHYMRIYIHY